MDPLQIQNLMSRNSQLKKLQVECWLEVGTMWLGVGEFLSLFSFYSCRTWTRKREDVVRWQEGGSSFQRATCGLFKSDLARGLRDSFFEGLRFSASGFVLTCILLLFPSELSTTMELFTPIGLGVSNLLRNGRSSR